MAGVGTPAAYVYNGQPGTSDAALYTSSGSGVIVQHLVAVNATGSAVTLTLSVHRAVSGAVETICSALSIPTLNAVELAYDVDLAEEGIELQNGDSLHGSAGTATAVTVTAF